MCGIIAGTVSGGVNVVPMVADALDYLDYRGYDSCGVAALNGGIELVRRVGEGKVLRQALLQKRLYASTVLGHTRWATEGVVSEENAHPHVSEHLAVVHNGTIKNWRALRERLEGAGYVFRSQTDTEVIAHLLHYHYGECENLLAALRHTLEKLEGIYAIVASSVKEPGVLVAARNRPPLLLGLGDGENYVSSDVRGVLSKTRRVVYLLEGDVAEVTPQQVRVFDRSGALVRRKVYVSKESLDSLDKSGFPYFMLKEIFHQPQALQDTVEEALAKGISPALFGNAEKIFRELDSVLVLACGTSYNAGLVFKSWLKSQAKVEAEVVYAHEYVHEPALTHKNRLILTLSQSGETFDTMEALKRAQQTGHLRTLSICNVPESSIPRASKLLFYTHAGIEVGVASTKAYTTQLAALFLLSHSIAKAKGRLSRRAEAEALAALRRLPEVLKQTLALEPQIQAWAGELKEASHVLFLGKGTHYAVVQEGALKFKEISYIHAEAIPVGELKHGPLALVDEHMPVIVCAPDNALLPDVAVSMGEIRARAGRLYIFADASSQGVDGEGVRVIRLPAHDAVLSAVVYAVPMQLLALHTAHLLERNVDKPRNLAKSVTVG